MSATKSKSYESRLHSLPLSPPAGKSPGGNLKEECVNVFVRFRPINDKELRNNEFIAWEPVDEYTVGSRSQRDTRESEARYAYDEVFSEHSSTLSVYKKAAKGVIWSSMEGVNGTIFAYGVTSSGKTHSMQGTRNEPGIIPLAVDEVFNIIQFTPEYEYVLRVSYLEIYNEVINDLLDPTNTQLKIREDKQAGVYVEGVKEEVVLSAEHALTLVATGEAHRHVGATNINEYSSRSHTIFRMLVESHKRDDTGLSRGSVINLIDLAGSESSRTNTKGQRQVEGSYINKSLLTLGTVIARLSDRRASGTGHVPYRDSKLTRLLQNSLSGNSRISVICTATPGSASLEETHNTLKFAHRAKSIEVTAKQNEILDDKSLVKKYKKEIQALKEQLAGLVEGGGGTPGGVPGSPAMAWGTPKGSSTSSASEAAEVAELRRRIEEEQQRLMEKEADKAALESRIQRLTKIILHSGNHPSKAFQKSKDDTPTASLRRNNSFGNGATGGSLSSSPMKGGMDLEKLSQSLNLPAGTAAKALGGGGGSGKGGGGEGSKSSWISKLLPASLGGKGESGDGGAGAGKQSSMGRGDVEGIAAQAARAADERVDDDSGGGTYGNIESIQSRSTTGDLILGTVAVKGDLIAVKWEKEAGQRESMYREEMKVLEEEIQARDEYLQQIYTKYETTQGENKTRIEEAELKESQLKEEIREKNRKMMVLEQKIEGVRDAQASTRGQFQAVLDKLRTELGEKNFEMQVAYADNKILQEQLDAAAASAEATDLRNKQIAEEVDRMEEGAKRMAETIRLQATEIEALRYRVVELESEAGGGEAGASGAGGGADDAAAAAAAAAAGAAAAAAVALTEAPRGTGWMGAALAQPTSSRDSPVKGEPAEVAALKRELEDAKREAQRSKDMASDAEQRRKKEVAEASKAAQGCQCVVM